VAVLVLCRSGSVSEQWPLFIIINCFWFIIEELTALTPETDCIQMSTYVVGLPPTTSVAFLIAVIVVKCRGLGGISEMPLLSLRIYLLLLREKAWVVCMYEWIVLEYLVFYLQSWSIIHPKLWNVYLVGNYYVHSRLID
jgi:hypothetical protein